MYFTINDKVNKIFNQLEDKINEITHQVNKKINTYEDWEDLPLYHALRTNKTSEQIKKEGFYKYGTKVDMKNEIMSALRYFGKEKLATSNKGKGYLIQSMLKEVSDKNRRNIWATTDEEAGCRWWAHASPEHISLLLHQINIEPEKIDKYLSEKYGKNCYNIKLKMTCLGTNPNFNTGLDYIPPNFIDSIEECKDCEYTGKEHITK